MAINKNNLKRVIIVQLIFLGFDFSMERRNFSLKGQSYCGLLRCQVDTITEDNVSSLIKMDIYYLNNRTLMATILSKDPEIQSDTRKTVNVTGSMSDHHGELRLYFTETADCMEAHFICRINFFLASGQTDFSEMAAVSESREKDGHDLYIKSQISYEQTISDPSDLLLKNLILPNDFLKNRMAFGFQTGNSDSITWVKERELTTNNNISQDINHHNYLKQCFSDLQSRLDYIVTESMTELSKNITNIFEFQNNRTAIEIQNNEKILQECNDTKLSQLDDKLNHMINKVEVCVTKKEMMRSTDDQMNIKLSLEAISKELNNLRTSQETLSESFADLSNTVMSLKLDETLKEALANLSSVVTSLYLQEKEIPSGGLKCERGMNSSLKPREVMSINSNTKILCDTKTDGGGWIIIQRRVNGDANFNVSWDKYKHGFGSLQGDFWLGNDVVSYLTQADRYTLRIDMRCENVDSYAVYDYFKVEDETQQYTLRLGEFSGNATDEFRHNKDMKFTTLDRDNDLESLINCAQHYNLNSGWWFRACGYTNLNGVWRGRVTKNFIYWSQFKECTYVEMKIRKETLGGS